MLWAPSPHSPSQHKDSSLSLQPAGTHRAMFQTAGPIKLASIRHNTEGAAEPAFCLHTSNDALLISSLLERRELQEEEGAGVKDNSFQLVSLS